jgi:hypothetical protein
MAAAGHPEAWVIKIRMHGSILQHRPDVGRFGCAVGATRVRFFPTQFPTEVLNTGWEMASQIARQVCKKPIFSKQNGIEGDRTKWMATV